MDMLFIELLQYLVAAIVIVVALVRGSSKRKKSADHKEQSLDDTNDRQTDWADFILSYRASAKTQQEKALIDRMLADIGISAPEDATSHELLKDQAVESEQSDSLPSTIGTKAVYVNGEPQRIENKTDNISLLLYFGAFLFVASAGLFVGFAQTSGELRVATVFVVTMVMYLGGLWMYRHKPKLQPAGLAFAGIGIAIAPLVGLSVYNYVLGGSSGAAVWLVTSMACFLLYWHALTELKKPLLNYVLIFTFLSIVESSIMVIDAPIYYLGWGLAATGLLLTALSKWKGIFPDLRQASFTSANIFMPLAILASLMTLGAQGYGQLAVSLMIGAIFYATEFMWGRQTDRLLNASVSQVSFLLSLSVLAYALYGELWVVAITLIVTSFAQVAALLARSKDTDTWENFGSILGASSIVAAAFAISRPSVLLFALVAVMAVMAVLWQKQKHLEGYVLMVAAWMSLPLVFGQLFLEQRMLVLPQIILLLVALLLQFVLILMLPSVGKLLAYTVRITYAVSAVVVLLLAVPVSHMDFWMISFVIALSIVILAKGRRRSWLIILSSIAVTTPVVHSMFDKEWLAITVTSALLANIAIAIIYRQKVAGWIGTALWLLLPWTLSSGVLGQWSTKTLAWSYIGITFGLILARIIARGGALVSGKVPLNSYDSLTSIPYVLGYSASMIISVLISIGADDSRLHTSLILTAVIGIITWLAIRVERNHEILVLLPILAQGLLLSIFRISPYSIYFDLYLLMSIAISAAFYASSVYGVPSGKGTLPSYARAFRYGTLLTASLVPISSLAVGETTVMMPIGLLVFTGMLYYHHRLASLSNREWIGGLALAGVWWLMGFVGVSNVQAYSHTLAALFALYAYIRHCRSEVKVSDKYLTAMLATATIPLVLQAISGVAGGLYGWWLLLEQVAFMLLGMSIGKPTVTKWGLYVAAGAVLYQLRGLGWAALTFLAVFLIGLAVYRLQEQDHDHDPKDQE